MKKHLLYILAICFIVLAQNACAKTLEIKSILDAYNSAFSTTAHGIHDEDLGFGWEVNKRGSLEAGKVPEGSIFCVLGESRVNGTKYEPGKCWISKHKSLDNLWEMYGYVPMCNKPGFCGKRVSNRGVPAFISKTDHIMLYNGIPASFTYYGFQNSMMKQPKIDIDPKAEVYCIAYVCYNGEIEMYEPCPCSEATEVQQNNEQPTSGTISAFIQQNNESGPTVHNIETQHSQYQIIDVVEPYLKTLKSIK